MESLRGTIASLVVGIATTLVVVAVAILPFFNPAWLAFEQDRAQAGAWTGFPPATLRSVTDSILADLVLGPPDFAVQVDGAPVLDERERQHMRDVRGVFAGFFAVALGAAAVLAGAFVVARGRTARAALWRRLAVSGRVIAAGTVIVGVLGVFFFDTAFELFHELFFPPGSFLFDPRTERMVQLFPETFWTETTIAVGVVIVALGVGLAWLGRHRSRALGASSVAAAGASVLAGQPR